MDLYRIEAIEEGGYLGDEEIYIYEVILYKSNHPPDVYPKEKFHVFRFHYSIHDPCERCSNGIFIPDYAYDILECDNCGIPAPMTLVGAMWTWGRSIIQWP